MLAETKTRLFLMRHGEVTNHHEFRYNGHHDVDITKRGVLQMRSLAAYFKEINLNGNPFKIRSVYSSDLIRTVKGARMIGEALGLEPKEVPGLKELHLGRWEGLTREEAHERYPEEAHFSFLNLAKNEKVKGGETIEELRARVMPEILKIVEENEGGSACVVAHGGVNRVVLCVAAGLPFTNIFNIEQDYGCLNMIDFLTDGRVVVKMMNGGPNHSHSPTVLY
ncbi:MAG: histidine phosphatase family protein [Deltaproteobacteria bacterium]|nr:histidine phosphatase family protein [Deltaproteobacteria bacterium]